MRLGVEVIGLLAGGLTTASFFAQLVKSWRTRDTKAISLTMYLIFSTGVLLWLAYGIIVGSISIIFWNAVILVCSLLILFLKLRHG